MAEEHPPEWYCGVPKKESRGGGTCRHRAGMGTDHVGVGPCYNHLGNAPNVAKAAHEKIAAANFEAWRKARGEPDRGGPVATMTKILHEAEDWYDYVRHLLGQLGTGEWQPAPGQVHAYVSLFERAAERVFKLAADFTRLGMEERLARITERQGEAIIAVLLGTVDELDLGEERRAQVIQIATRRLQAHPLVTGADQEPAG